MLEVRAEDTLPPDSTLSPDYHMYAIAMWKKGKGAYCNIRRNLVSRDLRPSKWDVDSVRRAPRLKQH